MPLPGDADMMLWHERDQAKGSAWVEEGGPVGQFYGLGGAWTKWEDLPEITKGLGNDSPARKVSFSVRVIACLAHGGANADAVSGRKGEVGRLVPYVLGASDHDDDAE